MQLARRSVSLTLFALACLAPAFASAQPEPQCERHSDCNDGNDCTSDICDNGRCENPPLDTPCDDRDECTVDTCSAETGCSWAPVNCDDGNACTADRCESETGCEHSPSDDMCDDGDACTTDWCDPRDGCLSKPTGVSCDDGNPCTTDSCDPATGACKYEPMDGASCDADSLCGTGMCQGGECVPTGPNPEDMGHMCGDVPAVGVCDGHTLKACVKGEVIVTNCLDQDRVCGWDDEGWDGWGAFGCVTQDSEFDACAGVPDSGKCVGTTLYWCDTDTGKTHIYDCAVDDEGCGWGGNYYCCQTVEECVPMCQGKTCGDDGCGGSCGECDGVCTESGHCIGCPDGEMPADEPNTDDGETGTKSAPSAVGDRADQSPSACTATDGPNGAPSALILLGLALLALATRRRLA